MPPLSALEYVALVPFTPPKQYAVSEGEVYYYGITHPNSSDSAVAIDALVGARVKGGIQWYSTALDWRLPKLHVVLPEFTRDTSYKHVYKRVLAIIKHVWEHCRTHPEIKWIMRIWDDTFVFPERVLDVARQYNADELIAIGNVIGTRQHVWIQGGAGMLVSRNVLRILTERLSVCGVRVSLQEDVTLSRCLQRLNVRLVHRPGFNQVVPLVCWRKPCEWTQAGAPPLDKLLDITPDDLACRRRFNFAGHVDDEARSPMLPAPLDRGEVPVALHYVHPACARRIHDAWYNARCGNAEALDMQAINREFKPLLMGVKSTTTTASAGA